MQRIASRIVRPRGESQYKALQDTVYILMPLQGAWWGFAIFFIAVRLLENPIFLESV